QDDVSGTLFSNYAAPHATRMREKKAIKVPVQLAQQLATQWNDNPSDPTLLRLQIRLGNRAAGARALALAVDDRNPISLRLSLFPVLETVGSIQVVPEL